MIHWATALPPGPTSPRLAVRDGEKDWSPTLVPMIRKSISRPFWLSMIFGWAEVIRTLLAAPAPVLVMIRPREKGTAGSTCEVNGSSP